MTEVEKSLLRPSYQVRYIYVCHSSGAAGCCLRHQTSLRKKRGSPTLWEIPLRRFLLYSSLSTETKLLNDSSVSLDIDFLEIVKDTTSLTNELQERATSYIVVLVLLEVLSKM